MLNSPFYFETLRKLKVAFGDLFNDIHIITLDTDGNVAKDVKVPINFMRKQKYIARLRQEAIRNKESEAPNVEISLPRFSYDIVSITPDPSRKTNTLNQVMRNQSTPGLLNHLKQYAGVPYNIAFELNAYTGDLDHMLQIVEQITPYFAPDFNVTITEIPELDIKRDIPVVLEDIQPEDSFDGLLNDYREIQWTFGFTAKTYFYPPIQDAKVIRTAINNINTTKDKTDQRITQAVDPADALETDTWTITKTIEDEPTT